MQERRNTVPRILILEDERVVARDLQNTLGTLGYEISTAASGEEAIEVARRDRPDLALVDIHLAGKLDGIETAVALRKDPDVPVVYLTAHSDEETLKRAKATEPLGYLVKPFDATTLQTTIQMAVHKGSVERRHRVEERLHSGVLDQLTVGIVTADAAGKVSMINGCGQRLTGWSETEAVGQDIGKVLKLCGPAKTSITAELLDTVVRGQGPGAPERHVSLVSKSGVETWVEHRVSRVLDESQQVVGGSLVFWPVESAGRDRALVSAGADEPVMDAGTGLPGRGLALAEIRRAGEKGAGLFAALFVLNRYYLIARKYGTRTADNMLTYYGTILAQDIPDCQGLYRWTGPCFLALIGPLDCMQDAQRSISRFSSGRSGTLFQPPGTTALLTVSGSVQVHSIDDKPFDLLVSQIDSYVATETKRTAGAP